MIVGDSMYNFDNEIPKHRKKKEPSISKSNIKSKHKHKYIDCLLMENGKPHKATYCKICGKVDNVFFLWNMSNNEIFEKYKDLVQIEVDSIWEKFVPISK